jgi:peptide/nickel transport system ATP-binding protein
MNAAAPATAATPRRQETDAILEVRHLGMRFGAVKAVDDISFIARRGRTLGLVGESGCGKTTTGRCIMRMYRPSGGEVIYRDDTGRTVDLVTLGEREMRPFRRQIRMVFQDPHSSLNPRMSVKQIVAEPLVNNDIAKGRELEDRVAMLLRKVGLRPEYMRRYPHAFSGGERQRIGIARALATDPRLVVCDEAVSALDVSVQAQTLNLLQDLQDEFSLTYLFVAHDLSVVEHISDDIAVMYVGKMVEVTSADALFSRPLHPYTEALLSAVPKPDPRQRNAGKRLRLAGEVADPASPPSGCRFHPRCPYAQRRCAEEEPTLREALPGRHVACHFAETLELRGVA